MYSGNIFFLLYNNKGLTNKFSKRQNHGAICFTHEEIKAQRSDVITLKYPDDMIRTSILFPNSKEINSLKNLQQ
jgi:hypothetical protein